MIEQKLCKFIIFTAVPLKVMNIFLTTTLLLLAILPASFTLPWEISRDAETVKEPTHNDNWDESEQSLMQTILQEGHGDSRIESPNRLAHIQDVGKFDGCYSDSEAGVLGGASGLKFDWSDNYNAKCQLVCQEKGYPIASTVGTYCYCTYSLPIPQLHRSDDSQSAGITGPCSVTCPGSITTVPCQGDECCGGPNATSVYIVGRIDAMKQLERRIINKVLGNSTLRQKILGDHQFNFYFKDRVKRRLYPYLNCNFNKEILTTEGTANSLEVYRTSNHANGVFKTAVHLGSGCSFERIKVTLIYDSYHYRKYGNIASVTIGLWNENKEVVFSKPYSHNDLYNLQVSTATIVADISVPNTRAWSMYVQVNYHQCYPVKAPEEYIMEGWGQCQPESYGVSVEAMGRTATSDGVSQSNTIYNLTWINGVETMIDVPPTESSLIDADKLEMKMIAMEKLIESDESDVREEPFSSWDIACDNIFGSTDLTCAKEFSETTGFEENWTTEHAVNMEVTIGAEFEAGTLFVKATTTFEVALGYSFTSSYSNSKTYERSEAFSVEKDVPPGYKTEIRFFKADIPVQIKWRATIKATGFVLVKLFDGSTGESLMAEPAKLHLTNILTANERKLFSFGTIDYGKRPTLIARTQTVDRDGNLLSQEMDEKPVAPDISD